MYRPTDELVSEIKSEVSDLVYCVYRPSCLYSHAASWE